MLSKLDDAKAELLDRAANAPGALGDPEDSAFLHRYYRRVAPEDLVGSRPRRRRRCGVLAPRARREPPAGDGPGAGLHPHRRGARLGVRPHRRRGRHRRHAVPRRLRHRRARPGRDGRIHLVVHPQLVGAPRRSPATSSRSSTTRSTPTGPAGGAWSSRGSTSRSTGSPTRPSVAAIERRCRRVLSDVREAVEDWAKMRAAARERRGVPAEEPPPAYPRDEVAEARRAARWLVDDHFTFLGYREYALSRGRRRGRRSCAAPGTGLGILRADQRIVQLLRQAAARGPRQGPRAASCSC